MAKWLKKVRDVFLTRRNCDGLVKSPKIVMPDLIRHQEHTDIAGFRLSPE
jgi:hypothetical protein